MSRERFLLAGTIIAIVFVYALCVPLCVSAVHSIDDVRLISQGPVGVGGNADSSDVSLCADGTKIAFSSFSTDLIEGMTTASGNVFLYDTLTGVITLVSQGQSGIGGAVHPSFGQSSSHSPTLSADGSKIAFVSWASDLDPDVTFDYSSGSQQVYLYDVSRGTTTLVSAAHGTHAPANNASTSAVISEDGNRIVYVSQATDLIEGVQTNSNQNIYLYDIGSETTSLVTAGAAGIGGNRPSILPDLSAGGNLITFQSAATDLVEPVGNGLMNIFLYNVYEDRMQLLTASAQGVGGSGDSLYPSISSDGRRVAFWTFAADLTEGASSGQGSSYARIVLYDADTHVFIPILGTRPNPSGSDSCQPLVLSPDGGYIIFLSQARDLVHGRQTTDVLNVFKYDMVNAHTSLVSKGAQGRGSAVSCTGLDVSRDGSRIAFTSASSDLVAGITTNGVSSVFMRERELVRQIDFDERNGKPSSPAATVQGDTVPEPEAPHRSGYVFDGWWTDSMGGDAWDFHTPLYADRSLYAHWLELAKVTFDARNGTNPYTIGVTVGDTVVAPVTPTMTGHTFVGWWTAEEGGALWDFASDVVTGDKALYAHWVVNETPVVAAVNTAFATIAPKTGDSAGFWQIILFLVTGGELISLSIRSRNQRK